MGPKILIDAKLLLTAKLCCGAKQNVHWSLAGGAENLWCLTAEAKVVKLGLGSWVWFVHKAGGAALGGAKVQGAFVHGIPLIWAWPLGVRCLPCVQHVPLGTKHQRPLLEVALGVVGASGVLS